jgi:hypothetical protein
LEQHLLVEINNTKNIMFIINREKNRISKIEERIFSKLGFKERDHVQEWIANNPTFFGEELLVIQKEFDGFNDTRERLDLLALDKYGDIVVIENKLDDSGRDVTWQVLKYASYCASLTKHNICDIYQQYLSKCHIHANAEDNISEFFGGKDFDEIELNKNQRIIMVSGKFRKEVTSTALWLLNNYKLKIQCFKITPYALGDQFFLNVEQIIPVKEIQDYMISMAEKKQHDAETQEELQSRFALRLEFWGKVLDKMNATNSNLFQNITPSKDSWIAAGAGISGLGFNFAVTKSSARVELFMARPITEENKFIFDELIKQKELIEKNFGGELIWERMDNIKGSKIKNEKENLSIYNQDDWDSIIDFLVDGMVRLEKALSSPLQPIKKKIKSK